jgi:hypothetical protein
VDANPFDFVWPVDQEGYEIWVSRHPEASDILGRDETRYFRGRGGPLRYYRPLEVEDLWLRFAESCNSVDGALSFASDFGLLFTDERELPGGSDKVDDFLGNSKILRHIVDRFETGDLISAAGVLTAYGGAMVNEVIRYDQKRAVFEVVLIPVTLLSALLHQAAEAISGNRRFCRCRNQGCSKWFRVGPRAHTARREFCSDRCRVASARRQKAERIANA